VEKGNRILIEMPLPSDKVIELRKRFQKSLEEFEKTAVSRLQVTEAIEAEDPAARTEAFDRLTGAGIEGVDETFVEQRRQLLRQADAAHRRLAKAKAEAAELADAEPGTDRHKRFLEAIEARNKAEDAYNKALADFMATSLDVVRLRRVLDMNATPKKDENGQPIPDSSERAQALQELYSQYPSRKAEIQKVVQTHDAYYAEKGPLDDPEDLKRLIEGAGVLAFRIVVEPSHLHPDLRGADQIGAEQIDRLRKELREKGPDHAGDPTLNVQWFELDNPESTIDEAVSARLGKKPDTATVVTGKFAMVFVILAVGSLIGFLMARKAGNKNAAAVTGVLAIVFAVGAVITWRTFGGAEEKRSVDKTAAEQLEGDKLRDNLRAQMKENPAAFFSKYEGNIIAEQYDGKYYVLLHDSQSKSMTHDRPDQAEWALARSYRSQDNMGRAAIGFEMDPVGSTLMGNLTGNNTGRRMAIVLDDKVISYPRIQSRISNSGIITGSFSSKEIDYMIRTLNAGSLSGKMAKEPIEERVFQPRMGAENLEQGFSSGLWAIIAVAFFMMIYYFGAGAVANAALAANIVIILGILSMYNATFTLPGIAGIVLTIGMCVDANVLIFERIREELRRGVETTVALRLGYEKAFSSIIDGNLTNLIVCFILGYTASAAIKGFAITLGIGIGATLFTALFMTRSIFELWNRFGNLKLSMLPTKVPAIERALQPKIDWIGKRTLFFAFSGVLLVGSLGLVLTRGAEMFDIEFRAGTEAAFSFKSDKSLTQAQVVDRLKQVGSWFEEGFDPATLGPEERRRYEAIAEEVAAARRTALQQAVERETGKAPQAETEEGLLAPIEDESLRKQLLAEADRAVDLSQLRDPTVVGLESGEDKGASFSLLTPITGSEAVSAAIRYGFEEEISVRQPLKFAHSNASVRDAPVYPITDRSLNEVLKRSLAGGNADNVSDFVGGAAILIEKIDPPATEEEIEDRLKLMRLQPDYEAVQYRPWKVVGLKAEADRKYSTAVVLV
ncbi:MAG: protein translocase subunit SecD, partial [Phycisphaeraceae bacterium]|nr:protein translocase subunit SecD [Phycisphaeraceae bacterium]